MLRIALDWHDVNRFGLMRVNVDWKSEIAWQIAADLMPRTAGVIAAHNVPVFLHEQSVWTRRMHRDPMHAVTDLRVRVRNVLRVQPAIDRLPRFSAVLSSKRAGGGDCDVNSLRIFRIKKDCAQTHAARSRLPLRSCIAASQASQFLPRFAAIFRFENRGILDARVNVVRIVERRFQMPHPFELPWVL